jgi:hypothetical protein
VAPEGRSVSVDRNRHGATVDLSAKGLPDPAESYAWSWGEGSNFGQNVSFTFWGGAEVTIDLTVCWADGECIERGVNVRIPACPIDQTQPSTLTLSFDGATEEYKIFRSDEDCQYSQIADFGASRPDFSHGTHVGEIWHVKDAGNQALVREYQFFDTTPISDTVPGSAAR